ncbi:MAG: histidine kinase [Epulopiscium sp.]|nr:histidine kinase [Candidatus Epulonipiscium sp.]
MEKTIHYPTNKISLQSKLIRLFLLTSIIPIIILSFFSYYNISNTLKKNTEGLTINNLEQMGNSLNIWLESYEDLLYQVYTDETVVALVDKINNQEDLPVTINQLRRFMRALLNTKEYIRSITIITPNGNIITYDQLTPVSSKNSWIENFSLTQEELYEEVSKDNKTHLFPTEYGVTFANQDYYMFHMAHRIIDYKDLEKKNGIVVVSIDEELLRNACLAKDAAERDRNNFNFIVDQNGRIISYIHQQFLTSKITDGDRAIDQRKKDYLEFIDKENLFDKEYISISVYRDPKLSWDLVNISNQRDAMTQLGTQQKIVIFISLLSLLIVVILTLLLSRQLARSIKKVVSTMQVAGSGNLDIRVEVDKEMPLEVEAIALKFNDMLQKLYEALKKEKEAGEMQRIAEIKALEAQINPHFLYNTLDTINWMAIDKDEFEISNAISSLATILRYGINNSNAMVEVREEVEWLKKYIYLQQTRLKNTFHCEMTIDPEVMHYKIHKLLLQPFIENAIIHGFEGTKREHVLKIQIKAEENKLSISIKDNGKGMEPSVVEKFNNRASYKTENSNHIGIENAISRLHMYYGKEARIKITSILGEGTEISILIPHKGERR